MPRAKDFIKLFQSLDLFSIPIELNFNKKNRFQSKFGAFVSLFIIAASLYFSIKQLVGWFKLEVPTTISASDNISTAMLINENRSIEYTLDYKNYGVYFVMWAIFPNYTQLSYRELKNYFTLDLSFTSDYELPSTIEYEDCHLRKTYEYLNLDYENIPENRTGSWSVCVKNPLKLGLITNQTKSIVYIPSFYFEVRQCKNSTLNNNSCASIQEIKEIAKFISVQVSVPNTIYDFKNQTNPIKRLFKYESYILDYGLKKHIQKNINPTYLYKDFGLFNEDYKLDSINFNSGQHIIDFSTRKEEDIDDNIFFQYQFSISFQTDKYYIRNQKLDDIIGSFGGIISVLYSLGSFICIQMNRNLFINSLINTTFRFKFNPNRKSKKIGLKAKLFPNSTNLKLSWFSLIQSKLKFFNKGQSIHTISKKCINEYIDLKKITRRLQDIDKMKFLLLSDSERYFFDLIPQPEITDDNVSKTLFLAKKSYNSKIGLKEKEKQEINENYENLKQNFTELDDKLISLLDPEMLKSINITCNLSKVMSDSQTRKKVIKNVITIDEEK